jgi:hypothetical protein
MSHNPEKHLPCLPSPSSPAPFFSHLSPWLYSHPNHSSTSTSTQTTVQPRVPPSPASISRKKGLWGKASTSTASLGSMEDEWGWKAAQKRRGSGQLLDGIGKGLGRVGSVIKRGDSVRRKRNDKGKGRALAEPVLEEEWEGDAGIGRPFNVEVGSTLTRLMPARASCIARSSRPSPAVALRSQGTRS